RGQIAAVPKDRGSVASARGQWDPGLRSPHQRGVCDNQTYASTGTCILRRSSDRRASTGRPRRSARRNRIAEAETRGGREAGGSASGAHPGPDAGGWRSAGRPGGRAAVAAGGSRAGAQSAVRVRRLYLDERAEPPEVAAFEQQHRDREPVSGLVLQLFV